MEISKISSAKKVLVADKTLILVARQKLSVLTDDKVNA